MEKKFWNYRIVEERNEAGEIYYSVRGVYYNEDGSIFAWDREAAKVIFESEADYSEMLRQLLEAKEKTILKEVDGEMVDTYDFLDDLIIEEQEELWK